MFLQYLAAISYRRKKNGQFVAIDKVCVVDEFFFFFVAATSYSHKKITSLHSILEGLLELGIFYYLFHMAAQPSHTVAQF